MSAVARRYYLKGREASRRGEVESAREDLRAALELVPTFVAARVEYASLLARTGDSRRAVQLLREALSGEQRPRPRVTLMRTLGDVLIAAGDYRGAEEAFSIASQSGAALGIPQSDLHDRLARVRAKTGRFAEALDELLAAARARR